MLSASISPKPIFDDSDWMRFYPLADCEVTEHGKEHSCHYLIANDKTDDFIVKIKQIVDTSLRIRLRKKRGKSWQGIDEADKLYKQDEKHSLLSPLHIAVIKRKLSVVEQLLKALKSLKQESRIDSADSRRWTPLHHAVISSKQIYDLLKKYGADESKKTNMDATSDDLTRLSHQETSIPSLPAIWYQPSLDETALRVKEYGLERFLEKVGLVELHDSYKYVSTHALWNQTPPGPLFQKDLRLKYTQYVEVPTEVVVAPSKDLADRIDRSLGLHTKNALPIGTIVGIFAGEVLGKKTEPKSFKECFFPPFSDNLYSCFGVDPSKSGSIARFANQGFPNVMMHETLVGGESIQLLITIESLETDAEILWDYGPDNSDFEFGPQILINKGQLEDFYRDGLSKVKDDFDARTMTMRKKVDTQKFTDDIISYFGTLTKIIYPINTPNAMLYLVLNDLTSCSEWFDLITRWNNFFFKNVMKGAIIKSLEMRCFLFYLDKCITMISKNEAVKKTIQDWALSKIGILSVMQIIKVLDDAKDFMELNEEIFDVDEFLAEWEKNIVDYNWMEDDKAPLGINRTKEFYLILQRDICKGKNLPDLKKLVKKLENIGETDSERYIYNKFVVDQMTLS